MADTTEEESIRQSARARRLQANGICLTCAKRPADRGTRGGMNQCNICRVRQAERRTALLASIRKERKHPLKPEDQRQASRDAARERRRTYRSAGICGQCGVRPVVPGPKGGLTYCAPCQDHRRRLDSERHVRRHVALQEQRKRERRARERKAKRDAIRAKDQQR